MGYYDDGPVSVRAPRGAFRTSPIFLGILVVFVGSGVLAWGQQLTRGNATLSGFYVFLFVVSGWLVSLCLHEFAHALVAYRAGDIGVAERGYLQLNPLKYAHWLMSIVIPILFMMAGGIALPGGAVMIDHRYIRSRAQATAISLAGPAVNLGVGVLLTVIVAAGAPNSSHVVFWAAMAYLAFFQLMAGVFNLLPVPGLDGGNAVLPWLNPAWQRGFAAVRPYGFFIVFLLLWQTSAGRALVNGIANAMIGSGVPQDALAFGQLLFAFWKA